MTTTSRAHFLCYDIEPWVLNDEAGWIYESGFWDITEAQANALRDGLIYFHEQGKPPSYLGGRVLDWRIDERPKGKKERGIVFKFQALRECRGVRWEGRRINTGWSGVLE